MNTEFERLKREAMKAVDAVTPKAPIVKLPEQTKQSKQFIPPLRQCPACKMYIDKGARICPYCREDQVRGLPAIYILFIIFGIVGLIAVLMGSGGNSSKIATVQNETKTYSQEDAYRALVICIDSYKRPDEKLPVPGGASLCFRRVAIK